MKITIRQFKYPGRPRRWFVDYKLPGGKRKRLSFASKRLAEVQANDLRAEYVACGAAWTALPSHTRVEVMGVVAEVLRAGLNLRSVWESYQRLQPDAAVGVKLLGPAHDSFIAESERALASRRTIAALKSNVGRFVKGREALPVSAVTREDVTMWLARPDWGPTTFNSYLTSLNTFFLWCKRLSYIKEAPTATIKKIERRRMTHLQDKPPPMLSLEQCAGLLKATLDTDRGLVPFVACALFAGLRPEREAARLTQEDLRGEFIYVRGLHAKTRQSRLVAVHPTLRAWLDLGGGEMPPRNLRRRFENLRQAAGLIAVQRRTAEGRGKKRVVHKVEGRFDKKITSAGWAQDCMRHTFASNYLPVFGADKTIEALGHGDYKMLFAHYRALVTPHHAALFWKLTPRLVKSPRALAAFLNSARAVETLEAAVSSPHRSES